MKAYRVTRPDGIDAIQLVDLPDPSPEPGQVVVRVAANSLNFRDLIIPKGGYPRNDTRPVIPLSDGAGEVVAVGEGVDRWKAGDRVMANFMRDWISGPVNETALRSGLGGGIDGMLAELVALPAQSLVAIPEHLSFEQAATLPCAGLTAWNALTAANLQPGQRVLLLGTGGVSVFGLQLAKAAGAHAIITSSSDEKLQRVRQLGADETINYKSRPEWHEAVLELTDGAGVDHVLEVGGAGTLPRSLQATRVGGTISLIGLLTQPEQQPSILPALLNAQTIRGIYVGSVHMLQELAQAMRTTGIEPLIDRSFDFDEALEAYRYFAQQQHVGKVVIRHG